MTKVQITESPGPPREYVIHIEKNITNPQISFTRTIDIAASPDKVFYFIARLGGEYGWYTFDWMLKIRQLFSKRPKSSIKKDDILAIGDNVSPFVVADIENDKYLILKFTNKLLEGLFAFYLEPVDTKTTRVYAITEFAFKNFTGRIYWTFVKPFDKILQYRMLSNIKRLAEKLD
jgi:hypothetical protein